MVTTTPVKTPAIKKLYTETGSLRQPAGAFRDGSLASLNAALKSQRGACVAYITPAYAERIYSLLAERSGVARSLKCDDGLQTPADRQLIPA